MHMYSTSIDLSSFFLSSCLQVWSPGYDIQHPVSGTVCIAVREITEWIETIKAPVSLRQSVEEDVCATNSGKCDDGSQEEDENGCTTCTLDPSINFALSNPCPTKTNSEVEQCI